MSSPYAGTSTYAATITVPSDGDPRTAASVSAPLQTLADRTAFLRSNTDALHASVDLARYLNWFNGAAPTTGNIFLGTYQAYPGSVYPLLGSSLLFAAGVTGGVTSCVASADFGASFGPDSLSAVQAGEVPTDIAVSDVASPCAVIACQANANVFRVACSNQASAKPGTGAGTITSAGVAVTWDRIRAKFVWVGGTSTATVIRTSSDGTTWGSGSLPTAWTTTASYYKLAARPDNGMVMGAFQASPTSFRFATTLDAASSWTTKASITTTISATSITGLTFDSFTSTWFATLSNVNASEIWKSTDDGVTWTLLYTTNGLGWVCSNPVVDESGTLVFVRSSTTGYNATQIVYMPPGATKPIVTGVGTIATSPSSQMIWTGNCFVALFRPTTAGNPNVIKSSLRTGAFVGSNLY